MSSAGLSSALWRASASWGRRPEWILSPEAHATTSNPGREVARPRVEGNGAVRGRSTNEFRTESDADPGTDGERRGRGRCMSGARVASCRTASDGLARIRPREAWRCADYYCNGRKQQSQWHVERDTESEVVWLHPAVDMTKSVFKLKVFWLPPNDTSKFHAARLPPSVGFSSLPRRLGIPSVPRHIAPWSHGLP